MATRWRSGARRARRSSGSMVRARKKTSAVRVGVVRIHLQRLGQLPRRAGELAQHQHAVAVGPGGDELLRHQVHPVAQRRHQHHVGGAVERHQVGRREAAEDVVHRHPARRAERAVDPADQPVHQRAEILVGLRRRCGRAPPPAPAGPSPAARDGSRASARRSAAGGGCPWCSPAGPRRPGSGRCRRPAAPRPPPRPRGPPPAPGTTPASIPIGKTPSRTSRPGSCTRSMSTVRPRMSVSAVAKWRR